MAPLAPIITQTAPVAPATSGTVIAQCTQPAGETDPGPFTYTVTETDFSVLNDTLLAAADLDGTYTATVMATSAAGDSPTTAQAINLATAAAPEDDYAGNPNIPPPLPEGSVAEDRWPYFITQATMLLVPGAREGVDFAVGKFARDEFQSSVSWDAVRLGARPDAEIEALARELASQTPFDPPQARRT